MTPHQNIDSLEDWVAETPESITARLEGAKASQAQIRFTLGTMAVISTMMLIVAYNAYLSYDYHWILDANKRQREYKLLAEQRRPAGAKDQKLASEEVAEILEEQALKDWAASRIVLISPLGIRVSIDDVGVLGSAVLLLLSLWLLLLVRRENHTIVSLLRHTDSSTPASDRDASAKPSQGIPSNISFKGERWRIFHTISSNSLFFTLQSIDEPGPAPINAAAKFRRLINAAAKFKRLINNRVFGCVRAFFFFFPVIAMLLVFGLDRRSYSMQDPFHAFFEIPGREDFFWSSWWVFLVCLAPLTISCWQSRKYSNETEKSLNDYGNKLRRYLLKEQRNLG